MRNKTTPFVLAVSIVAIGASITLPAISGPGSNDQSSAILVLATFSLVGELLSVLLPKDSSASMAAIPLSALIAISPTWQAVAGVVGVKTLVEIGRKREIEKAIFNIANYAFSMALGAHVFVALGGTSLLNHTSESIAQVTRAIGVASFAGFFTLMASNLLLVTTVVALSSGAGIAAVWRTNSLVVLGLEILSSPLIFVFGWVYVRFGAIISATAWLPIVGIRQAQKTNIELARTNEELLELMVKSIEARDSYTSGHSRRVQEYSMLIARAVGLSEKEVAVVGQAALLHDVGKIHEKYGPILRKADRLSADEWVTMREHPVDGANLIATMTRLRSLVGAVRHHHENWDGTGYPDGLAGELIPVAARIIRFADTIDAMTSERPYRGIMTEPEVRAEIIRCRATQFDPVLVDRLLSSPSWKTLFAPNSLARPDIRHMAVLPTRESRTASRLRS